MTDRSLNDVSAWSLYTSGGQIGFTVNGGTTTKLDNFGGGTYTGLLPPQTDSAFRTVAYSSPRDSEANTPAIVVTPPANQTWRSYYYLGGKRIAMRTRYGNGNPDVVNYLHGDHLGSTSLTTNASGGLVAQARYYPYGGIRWESGTTPTDYRFTGQHSETSIGLYDYGARFYDPLIGRFISADTIVPGAGNPQALNRFAYALNNPLKYTDPSGHVCIPCIGVAIIGIGVGWEVYDNIIGPALGQRPDHVGVDFADKEKSLVVSASGNGVEPIALGAGLAIQSQWSNFAQGSNLSDPSLGHAKLRPSESRYFPGGDYKPYDDAAAITALGEKIRQSALACPGSCSTTDRFIVMALAQNGFLPESVRSLPQKDGHIDWNQFFASRPAASDLRTGPRVFLNGCKAWDCFQLQVFINDLLELKLKGWDLPPDVNIGYMQCLASGSTDCKP